MKYSVQFLVALLLVGAGAGLGATYSRSEDPQKAAIARFYELRERTLDQRGTDQDVEGLLALLAEEAMYEHPVAKVSMTRNQARAGMMAHLREGRDAQYHIKRVHFGENGATVEVNLKYTLVDGDKTTAVDRNGVAIFEFNAANKIVRIAEY